MRLVAIVVAVAVYVALKSVVSGFGKSLLECNSNLKTPAHPHAGIGDEGYTMVL